MKTKLLLASILTASTIGCASQDPDCTFTDTDAQLLGAPHNAIIPTPTLHRQYADVSERTGKMNGTYIALVTNHDFDQGVYRVLIKSDSEQGKFYCFRQINDDNMTGQPSEDELSAFVHAYWDEQKH